MAIGLGGSLLARDEQNHTLELVLGRPLSRAKLLAAKALCGMIMMTIVSVAAALATVVLAEAVDMEISLGYCPPDQPVHDVILDELWRYRLYADSYRQSHPTG